MIQEYSPAQLVGRVMAIYTAIATATSLAGISFFGWLTEQANEYVSVIGIGVVLLVLGIAANWFSRRVTAPVNGTEPVEGVPLVALARPTPAQELGT
jgi:hypothetical protein